MNSTTIKQGFVLIKSIKANLYQLRYILLLLVMVLLAACGDHTMYIGTCAQQTRQFAGYIHSIIIDELNPAVEAGLKSGPTAALDNRLLDLDEKVFELSTPKCNPKTQTAKEMLRLYMLAVRNYFSTVAGRAVYGEGAVQGQLSGVTDAGLAFETAMEDLFLP